MIAYKLEQSISLHFLHATMAISFNSCMYNSRCNSDREFIFRVSLQQLLHHHKLQPRHSVGWLLTAHMHFHLSSFSKPRCPCHNFSVARQRIKSSSKSPMLLTLVVPIGVYSESLQIWHNFINSTTILLLILQLLSQYSQGIDGICLSHV